jgi:hypothetical protein
LLHNELQIIESAKVSVYSGNTDCADLGCRLQARQMDYPVSDSANLVSHLKPQASQSITPKKKRNERPAPSQRAIPFLANCKSRKIDRGRPSQAHLICIRSNHLLAREMPPTSQFDNFGESKQRSKIPTPVERPTTRSKSSIPSGLGIFHQTGAYNQLMQQNMFRFLNHHHACLNQN